MSALESLRRAWVLALACASLLAPNAAHAGMGALWNDLVCSDPAEVANGFDFETSFVGLPDCLKLCADARTVCRRHVDDATRCQTDFAKDWIAFDSAVDCALLTGSRLSDCKAGWAIDLQAWQQSILGSRFGGRLQCEIKLLGDGRNVAGCLRRCTGQ